MRKIELEVEHLYRGRFVGRHKFKPHEQELITVGSARNASIRLLGEEINSLHCSIECRDNSWVVSDLGSETGTWVKKSNIVEHTVSGPSSIHIGQHTLKMYPHDTHSEIFTEDTKPLTNEGQKYHQVIVRKQGYVTHTKLLKANEKYAFYYGKEKLHLNPPEDENWVYTDYGEFVIQQRVIRSKNTEDSLPDKMQTLWDPNFKVPLLSSFGAVALLFALLIFKPGIEDNKLEQTEIKMNKYTKIIYDAQSTKKQKAKANKIIKEIAKSSPTPKPSQASGKTTVAKNIPKSKAMVNVSKSLKKAGLSKLIGKIAKRNNKNAVNIEALGNKAGSKASGRALASVGKASVGDVKAKKGDQFKIGGVATVGKGTGASGSLRGSGSLSAGGVGTANVGIVEEETEVRGGLAREVIAQTIQGYLGQIRYCYERQLSAQPDLYGKVIVNFTISGNGKVGAQQISSTTLKNSLVEGCILRRISGWRFPTPEGGTSVVVKYPFMFRSLQ